MVSALRCYIYFFYIFLNIFAGIRKIQDHLAPLAGYKEKYAGCNLISSTYCNDYHKFKTGVKCFRYWCVCVLPVSGCVCFLISGICEDTCCTQEPLYGVCVEIVRLTDSSLSLDAHVLSEHVQKGGVELAALGQFSREAVVMLLHLKKLVPLSTQQVKRPHLLSHWHRFQLFTRLPESKG